MNKATIRTMAVCIGIPLLLWIFTFVSSPSASDTWTVLGLIFICLGLLYIIPGIVLVLIKDTNSRNVGKGMLLSVALLMLVGFSVCSVNPVSFH